MQKIPQWLGKNIPLIVWYIKLLQKRQLLFTEYFRILATE